jgi:cytochrome oxidase assembly protein ShyY1
MARTHTTTHTIATLILLGVLVAAFVSLGNWQLRRADERHAISQAIDAGRQHIPLHLNANTPDSEFINWRKISASGTWLNSFTVLLENRNFKGMPGYWVATPLLIDASTHTAVLVLRGWLARPLGPGQTLPPIPAPEGTHTLSGELVDRVPRLFELWSFNHSTADRLPAKLPLPGTTLPQIQNLDLHAYAQSTGLKLLPTVVEQTSDDRDGLGREWPQPSLDADKNIGYAMQWFTFAAIAGIAWLVTAVGALRRRKTPAPKSPPPAQT